MIKDMAALVALTLWLILIIGSGIALGNFWSKK